MVENLFCVWICALRDDGKAASRRAEASERVEQILLVTGGGLRAPWLALVVQWKWA